MEPQVETSAVADTPAVDQKVYNPRTGLPVPTNWRAGIGRAKGSQNKLTKERIAFVEMVVGKPDSPELVEFAANIRKQFMDGSLNPQIAVTILHWWLGKPKETVELKAEVAQVERIVREVIDVTPDREPNG
jgi:hypothetical protein